MSLVPVLQFSPFGAINRIVFSRLEIESKNVLETIDEADPSAEDDNTLQHVHAQVLLVTQAAQAFVDHKELNPIYKAREVTQTKAFFCQLVNFCMEQWTMIPSDDYHGVSRNDLNCLLHTTDIMLSQDFIIIKPELEENHHHDSLTIYKAHTCDRSIVFPGCARKITIMIL
jgi:hypothetical protein